MIEQMVREEMAHNLVQLAGFRSLLERINEKVNSGKIKDLMMECELLTEEWLKAYTGLELQPFLALVDRTMDFNELVYQARDAYLEYQPPVKSRIPVRVEYPNELPF